MSGVKIEDFRNIWSILKNNWIFHIVCITSSSQHYGQPCREWTPQTRLGANSGMFIFHTFSYTLDAKKLQMYWNFSVRSNPSLKLRAQLVLCSSERYLLLWPSCVTGHRYRYRYRYSILSQHLSYVWMLKDSW